MSTPLPQLASSSFAQFGRAATSRLRARRRRLIADPGARVEARWRPTEAWDRALLLAVFACGGGLALGRADVVLLGAPVVLATLLALVNRPGVEGPTASAAAPRLGEQGALISVPTSVTGARGAELVTVRLPRGSRPLGQSVTIAAPKPGRDRTLTASRSRLEWGVAVIARPDIGAATADGLLMFGPVRSVERRALMLPAVAAVQPGPAPPRPASTVGAHRTRRAGEGSELLDIREFAPGDRIRRIDWRVTARRDRLHVRRTAVDADADVALCLDTRFEVGADVASWAPPPDDPAAARRQDGSLDVMVRAAVAIAAAHLRNGDRVTVLNLAQPSQSVRAGSGQRQLTRIRMRLARTTSDRGAGRLALRASAIPTGAIVIVLSPYLDDPIAELAVSAHRRGAQVVALDVLPWPLKPDSHRPGSPEALRIVLAERQDRLAALARAGVPVLRWEPAAMGLLLHRIARSRDRRRR